jgi:hypothetical protein
VLGHWLAQQAREFGRQPLFLNLDETAIKRAHPGSLGWIVSKSWWPGALRPHQKISKQDERSMITHVGLITHNTTVQGCLPQILIGNERIFTPELMADVSQVAPSKVHCWRCKSSWNTSKHMLTILREIALAMSGFPEFQPILVMDCATIHLSPRVSQCCEYPRYLDTSRPCKMYILASALRHACVCSSEVILEKGLQRQ